MVKKNKIIELVLNTPENYWFIIFGYHFHKTFWGVLLIVLGLILLLLKSPLAVAVMVLSMGTIIEIIGIAGHLYTNHRPTLCFVCKYRTQTTKW